MVEIDSNWQVRINGVHVGSVDDAKANWPDFAAGIDAAAAAKLAAEQPE